MDADDEIGRKLTRIEEHVFRKNKNDIVKFLKESWVGTEHQNDVADTKVRYDAISVMFNDVLIT